MKKFSTITTFVLIGIMVMLIGALAGWYVVLRIKGQTLTWQDAARGFGIGAPSANQNGSTYSNMGISGSGGSFAVGGGSETGDASTVYGGGGSTGSDGSDSGSSGLDGSAADTTQGVGSGSSTIPLIVFKTPRLWHVTKAPIAGFAFATSSPGAYFAERATGYVFHADEVSGEILRRTNTLMPKTYSAILARDGGALYQSVNDATGAVQTFSGIIGSSTSSEIGSLVGVNLRNNILAIDANPSVKNIFFIMAGDSGFIGITEPWVEGKSGKEKQVFASTIGAWRPYALSDGRLIIAEKPQDGTDGYAYEIQADGTLKPLVRAAPGLTLLPLAGSSALIFGTSDGSSLSLYAQTSTTTYALPIKTVADKCAWAPYIAPTKKNVGTDLVVYCAVPEDASMKNFLESWYMGALHTSDSWWRIDLTTGDSVQVLDANSQGANLDVVDPAIDSSGTLLGFKNGADDSLWVLRISK